jgi:hypothetical protein
MSGPIQEPARVIAFPMQRARTHDVNLADVVIPAALRRRPCSVLPLRRGDAARTAALLVKLRWLHVEIQVLNAREKAQFTEVGSEPSPSACLIATRLK